MWSRPKESRPQSVRHPTFAMFRDCVRKVILHVVFISGGTDICSFITVRSHVGCKAVTSADAVFVQFMSPAGLMNVVSGFIA
jgi:hypothetical protein